MSRVWCIRARDFVSHVRASTKTSETFRRLQTDHLRQEGAVDGDGKILIKDEDGPEEVEEEVVALGDGPGQERKLTRMLSLVPPMDTRWNSLC